MIWLVVAYLVIGSLWIAWDAGKTAYAASTTNVNIGVSDFAVYLFCWPTRLLLWLGVTVGFKLKHRRLGH